MGMQLLGAYLNGFQGGCAGGSVWLREISLKGPHGTRTMDGQMNLGCNIFVLVFFICRKAF